MIDINISKWSPKEQIESRFLKLTKHLTNYDKQEKWQHVANESKERESLYFHTIRWGTKCFQTKTTEDQLLEEKQLKPSSMQTTNWWTAMIMRQVFKQTKQRYDISKDGNHLLT